MRSTIGGILPIVILSFGILRQVLQLIVLTARGERANPIEVLVLRTRSRCCDTMDLPFSD